MIIYRTLFVESFAQIDFDNFGRHWSEDINFSSDTYLQNELHSTSNRSGEIKFTFEAQCKSTDIDSNATKKSRTGFSHEQEIVLKPNINLKDVKETNWGNKYGVIKNINVGTSCDDWLKNEKK